MALYPRLLGHDDSFAPVPNKIPIHQFQALVAEWTRGKITGAQAQTIVTALSGATLDASELASAQALVDSVLSIPVTGAQAAQANGRALRALRALEIDHCMLLADSRAPGYDTPTALQAKLGQ